MVDVLAVVVVVEYFKGVFLPMDLSDVGADDVEEALKGFVKLLFKARGDGLVYRMLDFFFFFNLSSCFESE